MKRLVSALSHLPLSVPIAVVFVLFLFGAASARADSSCDTLLDPTIVPVPTNSAGTPACVIQGQTSAAPPTVYDLVNNFNNSDITSIGNLVILADPTAGTGTSNWAGVAVFENNLPGGFGSVQFFTTAGTDFSTFTLGAGFESFLNEGTGGSTLWQPQAGNGGSCGDGVTDCYLFQIGASTGTGGGVPEPGTLSLLAAGLGSLIALALWKKGLLTGPVAS